MKTCIFCTLLKEHQDILFENDDFIVIKDIAPKAPIHLLAITKRHIKSLAELEVNDQAMIGRLVQMLPNIAKDLGMSEGFRTTVNTGRGGGQMVDHIHFHLLGGGQLPAM